MIVGMTSDRGRGRDQSARLRDMAGCTSLCRRRASPMRFWAEHAPQGVATEKRILRGRLWAITACYPVRYPGTF